MLQSGYLFAQSQEVERLHKVIGRQVNSINDDLQNEFQRHLAVLKQLSMTKTDFTSFSHLALNQYPALSRLEWLDAHRDKNGYHFTSVYTVANKDYKTMDNESAQDLANKIEFGSADVTVVGKNEFLVFMPAIETGKENCNKCLKSVVVGTFNIKNFVKDVMGSDSMEHLIVNLLLDQGQAAASVDAAIQ